MNSDHHHDPHDDQERRVVVDPVDNVHGGLADGVAKAHDRADPQQRAEHVQCQKGAQAQINSDGSGR